MSLTIARQVVTGVLVVLGVLPLVASAQTTAWQNAPFEVYEVPAISSIPRLTDTPPVDGRLSDDLSVIAAKGEYEPSSFVITPKADIDALQLTATDLKGPGGIIPAASVDLKVVKLWYQGGTAWYSYFADTNRRRLVPELLLSDETLIKVDTEKHENYLRVGNEYQWVSYPADKAEKMFDYFTEPVADAKTIQPITLKQNENKQIWVTVHVPTTAKEGVYTGSINMVSGGKTLGTLTLNVRVLPFELPLPKTYYNLDNPFLVTLYNTSIYPLTKSFNIPDAEADRIQNDIFKNLLAHNVFNTRVDMNLAHNTNRAESIKVVAHEVEMIKNAGFVTKPLITSGWGFMDGYESPTKDVARYTQRLTDYSKTISAIVGHHDIYITSWDEAPRSYIMTMRPLLEIAHKIGFKVWITTREDLHFDMEGYVIDYANHGGWPSKKNADTWHAIGSKVASYAGPHTGPENPVIFRRFEGLSRYKANYDGSFNYQYYTDHHTSLFKQQKVNVWNDFQSAEFRRFNLVYPTKGGPVDTLAFEGFREGIDDIRYATLLKQEAAAAIASSNVEAGFVAKKALIWLELLDDKNADLNTARMEMIDHILKIQKAMGK